MNTKWLLEKLGNYHPIDLLESGFVADTINFVSSSDSCFSSEHSPSIKGHVTGSAWLLNVDKTKVLLTHHKKLDRWLQLGGHSDGNPNVLETALREAREESGISAIMPILDDIFDIDVHEIPAKKNTPKHFHYDIRFLLSTVNTDAFIKTEESHSLSWLSIDEVETYNSDESILRMCRKWKGLSGSWLKK